MKKANESVYPEHFDFAQYKLNRRNVFVIGVKI
jgi:hypothetical protein